MLPVSQATCDCSYLCRLIASSTFSPYLLSYSSISPLICSKYTLVRFVISNFQISIFPNFLISSSFTPQYLFLNSMGANILQNIHHTILTPPSNTTTRTPISKPEWPFSPNLYYPAHPRLPQRSPPPKPQCPDRFSHVIHPSANHRTQISHTTISKKKPPIHLLTP